VVSIKCVASKSRVEVITHKDYAIPLSISQNWCVLVLEDCEDLPLSFFFVFFCFFHY